MPTRRSGWTNVRVCLDCGQRIGEGDRCACPPEEVPFVKGAEVTLCFDAACERPVRLASVGRVGNGAFRVAESAEWFALDGSPRNGGKLYARARRPGDEELLRRREEARALLRNVEQKVRDLADLSRRSNLEQSASLKHRREARRLTIEADSVNIAAVGEAARQKAEAQAAADIARLRAAAVCNVEEAKRRELEVQRLGRAAAEAKAWLESLPEDIKACRRLGDEEALRQYLSAV